MMSIRMVLAVAVAFASLALMGWALAVLWSRLALPGAPDPLTAVGLALAMATFPLVGVFILVRRPDHPIGWLFVVAGLGLSVGVAKAEYVTQVLVVGRDLPAVDLVAWVGEWGWIGGVGFAIPLLFLLFPNGQLTLAGRALVAAVVVTSVATMTGTALGLPLLADGRLVNPFRAPGPIGDLLETMRIAGNLLVTPMAALAAANLVIRAVGSSGTERQQFKWFASAVAVILAGIVSSFPSMLIDPARMDEVPPAVIAAINVGWSLVFLGVGLVPVATGAAILRYRLFEIDRIVSRTVSWALVTGILAVVFGAAVLTLQAILSTVTQGETLAVAASTLVASAMFQPLRRRVQTAVDRRFDRSRVDRDRLANSLARMMRAELEPVRLQALLAATVHQAFRPSRVGVSLSARPDERTRR